jgi:large subunit ribosomal protein L11
MAGVITSVQTGSISQLRQVKARKEKDMAKKVTAIIKLQCPAQKATPAPPIGPALGPHGVSAPKFVQEFNERSKSFEAGLIVPVVISVYSDKSFSFIMKTPPASILIKKELGLAKASSTPNKTKVGKLTKKQCEEVAKMKLNDLNSNTLEAAMKVIAGTARSMGVEVEK